MKNKYYRTEVQVAFHKMIDEFDWNYSIAFTAHYEDRFSYYPSYREANLRHSASKINQYFFNRLEKSIFGNTSKPHRGNKKLRRIVAIESGAQRMHTHMVICFPRNLTFDEISEKISKAWNNTHGTIDDLDIKINEGNSFDASFGGYITKQTTKRDIDCIDIMNCILTADA